MLPSRRKFLARLLPQVGVPHTVSVASVVWTCSALRSLNLHSSINFSTTGDNTDGMLARAANQYQRTSAGPQKDGSAPHATSTTSAAGIQRGPLMQSRTSALNRSFDGSFTNPSYKNPATSKTFERSHSTVSTASSASVVAKLHEAVYFDENDFVDDDELDFDEDSSPILPKAYVAPVKPANSTANPSAPKPKPASLEESRDVKAKPLASISEPALPVPKQDSNTKAEAKSAYFIDLTQDEPPKEPGKFSLNHIPSNISNVEWSSSPLHHKATPPNSHLLQRPQGMVTKRKESPTQDLPTEELKQDGRPKKRRTIPWIEEEKKQREAEQAMEALRAQKYTYQDPTATPASKTGESPYLWNKTASAMKQDQLKHRQAQNKKPSKAQKVDTSRPTKSSALEPVAKIFLSEEQKRVLQLVCDDKKSVFFTGSAGTGKSVLMREIIQKLRLKYSREQDRVAVTASTGLAACNIGGVTLHSFSGIGLGKEPVEQLVKKIKKNQKSKMRWLRTKVLVIDEISMVDGELFDKLENIARIIRNNGRPFGGIQLIMTGDFFQLPPVPDREKRTMKFAFDASTWSTTVQHTIGLTHIFRQRDPEFAAMLNEMRVGRLSQESIAKFQALQRRIDNEELDATELYPRREDVESANAQRMRLLGGNTVEYLAIDGGTVKDDLARERLLQHCIALPKLILKKGAQVMLIKNIDDQLVNGSIGKVIAFMDDRMFGLYCDNEKDFGPQESGEEFPSSFMDASKSSDLQSRPPAGGVSTSIRWPLVRFQLPDGTSRDLLVNREQWKIELPNGEVQASRSQVPLILAWALSIHKAQGQTLEKVRVNLSKTFEKGQVYVALSRATTKAGLQVIGFDPRKVMAHERVRQFYDSLYSVDKVFHTSEDAVKKQRSMVASYFQEEEDEDLRDHLFVT